MSMQRIMPSVIRIVAGFLVVVGAGAVAVSSGAVVTPDSCRAVTEEVAEIRAFYDAADETLLSKAERTEMLRDLSLAKKAESACTTSPTTTTTTVPTPTTVATTTTTQPPSPGSFPTEQSTGPEIANPPNIGAVDVYPGQTFNYSNVVISGVFLHGGGSLTLDHVRITGSVVVMPQVGNHTKFHMSDSAVHNAMTVNVIDSGGNLHWGGEQPVDVRVQGSWVNHPQGDGQYHTEALAGFGWPSGAQFLNSTFVQQGPFNGTATGAINWHGADSVFDGCWFGYGNGTAAYYTLYVEGRNNRVINSTIGVGLANYVYPDSAPHAAYHSNVNTDGEPLNLP